MCGGVFGVRGFVVCRSGTKTKHWTLRDWTWTDLTASATMSIVYLGLSAWRPTPKMCSFFFSGSHLGHSRVYYNRPIAVMLYLYWK